MSHTKTPPTPPPVALGESSVAVACCVNGRVAVGLSALAGSPGEFQPVNRPIPVVHA